MSLPRLNVVIQGEAPRKAEVYMMDREERHTAHAQAIVPARPGIGLGRVKYNTRGCWK